MPNHILSSTLKSGHTLNSCETKLIPISCASLGLCKCNFLPCISIVPLSGITIPVRIFTRVLLPAPFSPQIARISPGCNSIEALSKACTPPYRLETALAFSREVATFLVATFFCLFKLILFFLQSGVY